MMNTWKYSLLSLLFFIPIVPGISFVQPNYCNVYGTVYIEPENPKEADFRVFIEDSEGLADVWVYNTNDKLFADKPGLWHLTNKKAFADFIIYVDSNKHLADFSIYYIDVESFAGCNE